MKAPAKPVLAHRLLAGTRSRLGGRTPEELLGELLDRTPVPVE